VNVLSPFLRQGLDYLVRSRLRGVWIRGNLPKERTVWAANHHSWWDPFVAQAVLTRSGQRGALIMDDANLSEFGFLRPLGIVGTSEVRTAVDLLRAGRVLVVFPEAELKPPGAPGALSRGAAWLALHADARLLAVATRVVVRGHEAPEAYVDISPVGASDDVTGTERLARTLTVALLELDSALAAGPPREPLPGYRQLVRGRRSWDERLAGVTHRARR
jgi:1-acyl-sn-glycerol-3-phosphate acyltransferase